MEWLYIIGLIVVSTVLLITEIIFVPGTTVVGVLGLIFCAYGIYLGYDYFGTATGTIILLSSLLLNVAALVWAFKSRSWERFSLHNKSEGTFNEDFKVELSVGQRGVSISSIRPVGKALFNEDEIEVRSNGGYIDENVEIEVIRIESNKFFVEPIN